MHAAARMAASRPARNGGRFPGASGRSKCGGQPKWSLGMPRQALPAEIAVNGNLQSARISAAGPAMLWPRSFRHNRIACAPIDGGPVGGPVAVRAKTCRRNAGSVRAPPAERAMLRSGAGDAVATQQPPAATAATPMAVAAGAAGVSSIIPGTMSGFSHHSSPVAGSPGRNPSGCRQTPRWRGTSSGQSGCPGPMPRRRHIQAMALPNAPRSDAASACAEPGGRSGRSCYQDGSVERRSPRQACAPA